MASKTNEQVLEAAIERQLTGTCLEELKITATSPDGVCESQVPFATLELKNPLKRFFSWS